MTDTWKVQSFSLATTAGAFYILCAIFDALLCQRIIECVLLIGT
jgi:hypothetical protein